MDAAKLNKKRKLKDAESVAEAAAATKKTKKTKKSKSPAPPVEPPSDNESGGDESEKDEAVDHEDDEQLNNTEGDGDESEGDMEDHEADGIDMPSGTAPVLPQTADSDLFEDLKLSDKTMKSIQEMGFEKMTAIQRSVRSMSPAAHSSGIVLPPANLLRSR
jgi:ATP-dependent RNA helicase DDX18/HAS1